MSGSSGISSRLRGGRDGPQLYITFPAGQIPLTSGCETPFPGEAFPANRKGRIMETQERKPEKRRRFFKRAAIATLIGGIAAGIGIKAFAQGGRSEEHTSELQSLAYLVCRLLLEKK